MAGEIIAMNRLVSLHPEGSTGQCVLMCWVFIFFHVNSTVKGPVCENEWHLMVGSYNANDRALLCCPLSFQLYWRTMMTTCVWSFDSEHSIRLLMINSSHSFLFVTFTGVSLFLVVFRCRHCLQTLKCDLMAFRPFLATVIQLQHKTVIFNPTHCVWLYFLRDTENLITCS